MAALLFDIDTGGLGEYASQNAWESAQQQDLTDGGGDTMQATCRASGDAADTVVCFIDGWNTAVGSYILVDAANGDEALKTGYSESRYRHEVTDDHCALSTENYVRYDRLQIKLIYFSAAGKLAMGFFSQGGASEIRISNCYLVGDTNVAANGTGINFNNSNIVGKVWNCIAIEFNNFAYRNDDADTAEFYNCIAYNNETGFYLDTAATIKNCVSFRNDFDFNDVSTSSTIDTNASDDNTGDNNVAESGGGVDWPDDFVDAANGDFTLKATSNLKWAGTPDPGSGLFSTDMEGDSYEDPPSLGVDEIVAAGVGEVFHENRVAAIEKGMKAQTAAGMGGVLVGKAA